MSVRFCKVLEEIVPITCESYLHFPTQQPYIRRFKQLVLVRLLRG